MINHRYYATITAVTHAAMGVQNLNVWLQVKACMNAEVILSKQYGNEVNNAYAVRIGYDNNEWTHLVSEIDGGSSKSFHTPQILDCDQFRTLWISWAEQLLTFGEGTVVTSHLISVIAHANRNIAGC